MELSSAIYTGNKWGSSLSIGTNRSNSKVQGGSRWSQSIYSDIYRQVGKSTFVVGLSRAYQSGVFGATDVIFEADFPLGGTEAALSLTRGFSQGGRHTGIALDITRSF